jgi:YidC/Oxa1 family membrane protein insertase
MFYFIFPSAISLRQKGFLWADDLSSFDYLWVTISCSCTVIILVCFYSGLNSDFLLYENDKRRSTNGRPTQEGMPDMAKMMKIMIYVSPLMMLFFLIVMLPDWVCIILYLIQLQLCLSLKLYYRQW